LANYPALDVRAAVDDLLYAALDDHSPTAIEERAHGVRVFFATTQARDTAAAAIGQRFAVSPIEVPDEDWARRSQENLPPIVVGRIRIVSSRPAPNPPDPDVITIAITPSMGFGTGHHATTRLCLELLQMLDVRGKSVLDVGTGSGVLAIAAARLGAARAIGIDVDPDAIRSARENLALNPEATHVSFDVADLRGASLPPSDIVVANLTGAMLVRTAPSLLRLTAPGGTLVVSGLLKDERDDVRRAMAPMETDWEKDEDEWAAIAVKKR
jgi:ribosomal protein L11 methyltransferase